MCIAAQTLRNLVNKSRQRITKMYSGLERKLKSTAEKEAALEEMRDGSQEGNDEKWEIMQYPIEMKIETAELSETEDTNHDV